jgi:molybdopterin-dependent oxidoreductase alpha subunit
VAVLGSSSQPNPPSGEPAATGDRPSPVGVPDAPGHETSGAGAHAAPAAPPRRSPHLPVHVHRRPRFVAPELWAGWKPNGLGELKPNHYVEIAETIWDNRRALPYALRILRDGVCDGCALGVTGFHDWTMDSVHLCTTRLSLLKYNTARPFDHDRLGDVAALRHMDGAELRDMGRLAYPMLRRRGDAGFHRIGWDDALDLAANRVRAAGPDRTAFYLTSRGITNEVYYVAQKVARFLGTNNIDNAARVCHSPSTAGLKKALGVGATTVSYSDVLQSDLVVIFGADVANSQPVFMKYLYLARKGGTKVVMVNPFREPGMERYWVPSNVESAIFGTKMTDDWFHIHTGGDVAFINGVLKVLIAEDGVDRQFIEAHASGFDELQASLDAQPFEDLERASGASRADMERFARLYASARCSVLVWAMGITQHVHGSDNVRAMVNLALSRGNVGRDGAGLMPMRGHSGVQGGAEMGAYATVFPGGLPITPENAAALEAQYGFPIRSERGLSAAEMIEAGGRGELDVLYSSGGNFLDVLPDPAEVHAALERVPLRVHQDIVVTTQMLVDPGEEVLLLPARTRYEQAGGGTETTTERRVLFSPHIPGPKVGEARGEWEIFVDLARRVDPARAQLVDFHSGRQIREEIARVIPFYRGIEALRSSGDQFQWGGERLCDGWIFPTPDGRAHFDPVEPPELTIPEGRFILSTRRGKQFNSMVFKQKDPLTGARRDALFMSHEDAAALGLGEGDHVVVRSDHGEVEARVRLSTIRSRNLQMFFPEANPLIQPGRRDPVGLVPDYNAIVEVIPKAPAAGGHGQAAAMPGSAARHESGSTPGSAAAR